MSGEERGQQSLTKRICRAGAREPGGRDRRRVAAAVGREPSDPLRQLPGHQDRGRRAERGAQPHHVCQGLSVARGPDQLHVSDPPFHLRSSCAFHAYMPFSQVDTLPAALGTTGNDCFETRLSLALVSCVCFGLQDGLEAAGCGQRASLPRQHASRLSAGIAQAEPKSACVSTTARGF
eukprot:3441834-Rhodomonas_salina.3